MPEQSPFHSLANCKRGHRRHLVKTVLLVLSLFIHLGVQGAIYDPCFQNLLNSNPSAIHVTDVWPPNTNIIPANSAAIVSHFGGMPSSQTFLFDGVVTINQTIVFTNCTILFKPNAQIVMGNSVTVQFSNCTLAAGCDTMWKGITTVGSTGCIVKAYDCNISDMSEGFKIYNSTSRLNAEDNVFTNNYISLDLVNPASISTILRNSFSTVGSLIIPYAGQIAEIGIKERDSQNLTIGSTTTGNGNSFSKMHCGIYLKEMSLNGSSVNIYDAKFWDITGETGTNPYDAYAGAAVFGDGDPTHAKTLTMSSDAALGDSYILNSDMGVILNDISSNISLVDIQNVIYGICTKADGRQQTVTDCSLTNIQFGIFYDGNMGNASVIRNNVIDTRNDIGYAAWSGSNLQYPIGIGIHYASSTNTNSCDITSNKITILADRGIGIELYPVGPNVLTELDSIFLNPPTAFDTTQYNENPLCGIWAQFVDDDTKILGNTIIGNSNSYYTAALPPLLNYKEPSGIIITGCSPWMECNNLYTMRYGFQFKSNCYTGPETTPNLKVNGNDFYDNAVGVMFKYQNGGSGTKGLGRYIGNDTTDNRNNFYLTSATSTWDTIMDGTGTHNVKIYFLHSPSLALPTTARKIFTYVPTLLLDESHPLTTTAGYSVTPNTGADTFACQSPYSFRMENEEGINSDESEIEGMEEIARGQVDQGSGAAAGWLETKRIYRFLRARPDLMASSPVVDSFFTSLQSSPFEQIRLAEDAYNLLSDEAVQADSAALAQAVVDAFAANDAIMPANQFDQYMQEINKLMLLNLVFGKDTLAADDLDLIETLAFSCLYSKGAAVQKARFLHNILVGRTEFDEDQLCAEYSGSARNSNIAQTAGTVKNEFKLYPNPASRTITIDYDIPADKGAVLQINTIFGQRVFSAALKPGTQSNELEVSALDNGIYFYQMRVNGSITNSGKLIITK